jgi:hypothetical protein
VFGIFAELTKHVTLLRCNFGHGHRIAARLSRRRRLRKVLAVRLVFARGEIGRGDDPVDVDKCTILFAHVLQGVLVSADRLPISRVPLCELPGLLPVFRGPRLVAGAREVRRDRFRRRFDDRRLRRTRASAISA